MICRDCNGGGIDPVSIFFGNTCKRCSGSGEEPTRDTFGPISAGYDEVPMLRPVPCAACGQAPEDKKWYWAFNCKCADVLSIPKKAEYVEAWNVAQEQRRQAIVTGKALGYAGKL